MSRAALFLLALGAVCVAFVLVWLVEQIGDFEGPSPRALAFEDVTASPPNPAQWETLVDLAGRWDFRLGDDSTWAGGRTWGAAAVPGAWEDAGYHGYDGYAWYRTTFALDAAAAATAEKEPPHLLLGRIDDVDEVWLNGVRLGQTGRMPPVYRTAAFGFRTYPLPPGALRVDGPNTLLVRVYDEGLEGGILEGPVALAVPSGTNPAGVPVVADLSGEWQFRTGDGDWAGRRVDDADWDTIRVPGLWEAQGYDRYDGIAWYRTTLRVSADDAARAAVLVIGAIDDLDEAFVNGVRVGGTGDLASRTIDGDEWVRERAYPVPARLLQPGENAVALRVYDGLLDGGVHRGPVALMTPGAFAERERRLGRDTR